MTYKFGYTIPGNLRVFKSNFDYFHGIGKYSKDECIERSLLVSGVQLVDETEYDDYIKDHQLEKIFTE